MYQVKMINEYSFSGLELSVNKFLKTQMGSHFKLIDIKHTRDNGYYYATIIYKIGELQ